VELSRKLLEEAVSRKVLEAHQAAALWEYLEERHTETPSFRAAHILFYLGGAVALGAMSLFMNVGWEQHGPGALLVIASCYCLLAIGLTEWLLRRRQLRLPAGITAALAVVMVPLMTYAVQRLSGFWPEADSHGMTYRDFHFLIDWRWVFMEAATIAVGVVTLYRYRLPFIVLPLAVAGWYLSMDLAPFLWGGDHFYYWSDKGKWTSVVTGLAMLVIAVLVDIRTRRRPDFAFWVYLAGVAAFWGGLTALDSHNEWSKLVYCGINVLMVALGAALIRRVFVLFGALGVSIYLGHLSYEVFKDSMLFPAVLAAMGLAVIAAGIYWQRNQRAIGARLRHFCPQALREVIELT